MTDKEEATEEALAIVENLSFEEKLKVQFMVPGISIDQVARINNVPVAQLRELAESENWKGQRDCYIAELKSNADDRMTVLRAKTVVGAVEELMEATASGVTKAHLIMEKIDPDHDGASNKLEHMAKAIGGLAAVTARLLAVSGPTQKVEMDVSGSIGFLSGGGPVAAMPVIDVDSKDITDL